MNFYKRFMGDYAKKTAHLSLMEHGAYTLLLDALYSTERGLPAGYLELFRICRAMTKPEQLAVAKVADEFFPPGQDGLRHNDRAARELHEAAPSIAAARENGKKGGRPPKETGEKPNGFPKQTPDESSPEPKPDSPLSLRSRGRGSRLEKDWELPESWARWAEAERPDLDINKTACTFADYWHGVPGSKGVKLDWEGTWRNWVRKEMAPRKQAQRDQGEWYDSRSGVENMGRQYGIAAWNEMEEQWPQYRRRVMQAVKGAKGGGISLDQLAAIAQQRATA